MKRYLNLLMLVLITFCRLATGHNDALVNRMPPSTEVSVTRSVGRHHTLNHQEPNSQSTSTQQMVPPTRRPDAYRLPYMSLSAQRLMQHPDSGVKIQLSEDGLWLIVQPCQSVPNTSEPLLQPKTGHVQVEKYPATVHR